MFKSSSINKGNEVLFNACIREYGKGDSYKMDFFGGKEDPGTVEFFGTLVECLNELVRVRP